MNSVVFADIDGTLIESLPNGGITPGDNIGALDRGGKPVSVHTVQQAALFSLLSRANTVVPVTGRSVAALGRVLLTFKSYAIAHHGAAVLQPDRTRSLEYAGAVYPELAASHPLLNEQYEVIKAYISRNCSDLTITRQTLDGLTVEVCVKRNKLEARDLSPDADHIETVWRKLSEARVHRNGNNLALLPRTITKQRAVRWVQNKLDSAEPRTTIGVGDSYSDLEFMAECDFCIVPKGSQIASLFAQLNNENT